MYSCGLISTVCTKFYWSHSIYLPGPVLLAAGLMTIMCSLEICLRLYKANKRVQDPDLDNLCNPHEVKHWMDPNIIPYGWGLFNKGEHEKPGEGSRSCVMIPILKGSTGEQVSINLFSSLNSSCTAQGNHLVFLLIIDYYFSWSTLDKCFILPHIQSKVFSMSHRNSAHRVKIGGHLQMFCMMLDR